MNPPRAEMKRHANLGSTFMQYLPIAVMTIFNDNCIPFFDLSFDLLIIERGKSLRFQFVLPVSPQ